MVLSKKFNTGHQGQHHKRGWGYLRPRPSFHRCKYRKPSNKPPMQKRIFWLMKMKMSLNCANFRIAKERKHLRSYSKPFSSDTSQNRHTCTRPHCIMVVVVTTAPSRAVASTVHSVVILTLLLKIGD